MSKAAELKASAKIKAYHFIADGNGLLHFVENKQISLAQYLFRDMIHQIMFGEPVNPYEHLTLN